MDRGRPRFPRGYSCPAVLTHPHQGGSTRPATGLSPAPARLPRRFASGATCSLLEAAATASVRAVQPPPRIGSPATERGRFGLLRVRSPLLAESRSISVPRGTEMFQFPRYPPPHRGGLRVRPRRGCPIREFPDHRLLAAPRDLSSPATPFVGTERQGIHRLPVLACPAQSRQY